MQARKPGSTRAGTRRVGILVLLTPAERRRIKAAAGKRHLTVSAWIRQVLFDAAGAIDGQ